MASLEMFTARRMAVAAGGTVAVYGVYRVVKGVVTIAAHEVIYRAGDSVSWIKPSKP